MYDSFAKLLKKDFSIGKIMKIKTLKKCKDEILSSTIFVKNKWLKIS